MMSLPLVQVAAMCGGTLLHGNPDAVTAGVAIDSRRLPAGALYVAIKGVNHDGHRFAAAAAAAGACAVLVDAAQAGELRTSLPAECAIIAVPESLAALQQLATAYRLLLGARVAAVTGSNGKTSTKEFTATVLRARFDTHATAGNLNNHIGLPLTMLAHDPRQSHGVYELGMNHPGEIAALAAIARPDLAIITTIGSAHIEFFGSTAAIAEEKLSLLDALGPRGTAIINLESPYADEAVGRAPGLCITTGIGRGDVRAETIGQRADGTISFTVHAGGESAPVTLPVPGVHMVQNALLALAAGHAEGVPLAAGAHALANGQLGGGRLQVRGWCGATIIDDSYNANPDSMKAALRTLAAQPSNARRIAVLGPMGELGAFSATGHSEVGACADSLGIDAIAVVGTDAAAALLAAAAGPRCQQFADHAACATWLRRYVETGDVVLVKGSRSAAMEKVLHLLEGGADS